MKINRKLLLLLTIIYIYLPIVIFLAGFTRIYIAVISLAAVGYFTVRMYCDYAKKFTDDEEIKIKWWVALIVFLFLTAVCFVAGFGGLAPIAGDWWKHNAVIADLTTHKWPVYYTLSEESMLTYYLGQYLVPTLVGKICNYNVRVSESAMGIWGLFGIFLVYLNLIRITRSDTAHKQIRAAYIMCFFCGALVLAQVILSGIYKDDFYSEGSYHWILVKTIMLQYRSNFVMLRWVYPQIIVPWLITMLFMDNREDTRHYCLLISPVLLYGTFSVLFLVFAAVVNAVYSVVTSKNRKKAFGDIFSLSNIVIFLTFGMIMIMYYWGYMQVKKPVFSSFTIANYSIATLPVYLVFCIFMFGIYSVCVYKEQENNLLFYVMVAALTIIPSFRMGLCNDWVMSTSIPALFMLMIYVIITLNNKKDTREYGIRNAVIIVMLLIGSWYPFMEMRDVMKNYEFYDYTEWTYGSMEMFSDRDYEDATEDLLYNYYTYDLDGKFFYEHIARNKINR